MRKMWLYLDTEDRPGQNPGMSGVQKQKMEKRGGGEMRHTPGPWMIQQQAGRVWIYSSNHPEGHICEFIDRGLRERKEANAHLIAAAPELLEALKLMREDYEDCEEGLITDKTMAIAKQAISKAEGRE